jgi:hypothetical protein
MPVVAVEATIWEAPPSKNDPVCRNSKGGRRDEKLRWQRLIYDELVALGLGSIPEGRVLLVAATVRFTKNSKQERENYRPLFSEALGDALRVAEGRALVERSAGVIADDTDDRWELLFDIAADRGKASVTIRLFWWADDEPARGADGECLAV